MAFFCSGVSTLSASERGLRAAIDAEVGSTALQGEFDRFLSELREVKCKSHAVFSCISCLVVFLCVPLIKSLRFSGNRQIFAKARLGTNVESQVCLLNKKKRGVSLHR